MERKGAYHDGLAVAPERVLKELREHRISVRHLHLHSAQCTIKGTVPRDFRLHVFYESVSPLKKTWSKKSRDTVPFNLFSANGNLQRHVRTRSAGYRNNRWLWYSCNYVLFSFSLHWFFRTWGVKRCLVKKYNLYFQLPLFFSGTYLHAL